jgi:hypothetical protein
MSRTFPLSSHAGMLSSESESLSSKCDEDEKEEELLLLPESVLRRFVPRCLRCKCLLVRRDSLFFFCLLRCCFSCSTVICGGWVLFSISSGDCGLICCGGSSNGWVMPSSSRRRLVVSIGGSEIWDMLDAKLSRNRWVIDGVPLATVITRAIAFCIRSRNCGVRRCCVAWQQCGATCSRCVSLRLTRFKSVVLFVRRQVLRSLCLVRRILWRSDSP